MGIRKILLGLFSVVSLFAFKAWSLEPLPGWVAIDRYFQLHQPLTLGSHSVDAFSVHVLDKPGSGGQTGRVVFGKLQPDHTIDWLEESQKDWGFELTVRDGKVELHSSLPELAEKDFVLSSDMKGKGSRSEFTFSSLSRRDFFKAVNSGGSKGFASPYERVNFKALPVIIEFREPSEMPVGKGKAKSLLLIENRSSIFSDEENFFVAGELNSEGLFTPTGPQAKWTLNDKGSLTLGAFWAGGKRSLVLDTRSGIVRGFDGKEITQFRAYRTSAESAQYKKSWTQNESSSKENLPVSCEQSF